MPLRLSLHLVLSTNVKLSNRLSSFIRYLAPHPVSVTRTVSLSPGFSDCILPKIEYCHTATGTCCN